MIRFFVLLLTLVVGCSSPPAKPSSDVLRISFPVYPATLDPRRSGDFVSATLIGLLYEGLTRCMPDGSLEMAIAESVEISADQKTYTFRLKDTYWSDGTPVTAHDFEASWKRQLTPGFPSLCSYLFYSIKNGEAAAKGECRVEEVAIHVVDDRTLEVVLERPTPYFLSLTAFPSFLPIPRHATFEYEEKVVSRRVVNGPFQIDQLIPQAEIKLAKNRSFWNHQAIAIEAIDISIVPDEMTALQMFERGELDWLGGALSPIPPDLLTILDKTQDILYFPMAASTFCTFNVNAFPFSNRHIRTAFSLAIDRDAIASKVIQGRQIPAATLVPPSLWKEGSQESPLYNREQARRELALGLEEFGVKELGPITLYFRGAQVERLVAQALKQLWLDELGVNVSLEQIDNKSHKTRLHKRDYQFALTYWIAQYDDPMNILERFKSKGNVKNYPGWEDALFLSFLQRAEETVDRTTRQSYLKQAEERMMEEMPIAPIYHWSNPVLCNSRIRNIDTTPSGGILFERGQFAEN